MNRNGQIKKNGIQPLIKRTCLNVKPHPQTSLLLTTVPSIEPINPPKLK